MEIREPWFEAPSQQRFRSRSPQCASEFHLSTRGTHAGSEPTNGASPCTAVLTVMATSSAERNALRAKTPSVAVHSADRWVRGRVPAEACQRGCCRQAARPLCIGFSRRHAERLLSVRRNAFSVRAPLLQRPRRWSVGPKGPHRHGRQAGRGTSDSTRTAPGLPRTDMLPGLQSCVS